MLIKPLKLDQVGSDWIRLDQIGSDWIRLDQIGSDWIKMDQIGSNSFRLDQIGLYIILWLYRINYYKLHNPLVSTSAANPWDPTRSITNAAAAPCAAPRTPRRARRAANCPRQKTRVQANYFPNYFCHTSCCHGKQKSKKSILLARHGSKGRL